MTETDAVTAPTEGATPLDAIIGHDPGSSPAESSEVRESDASASDDTVPLGVLKRVRERQKRDAAKVKELEDEIERYRAEKFEYDEASLGLDEIIAPGAPAAPADPVSPQRQQYVEKYDALTARLGPEKIAEINAALNRLSPTQQAEVDELARVTGDPEIAIGYLEQLGLLYRRPSLDDVLSGKQHDPAANAASNELQARQSALDAREQQLAAAEFSNFEKASQSAFASKYGAEAFNSLDATVGWMVQNGHPLTTRLAEIYRSAQDPASAAAAALSEWGLWSAPAAQPQRPVMPSNFSAARSVAGRHGPAWSGPKPLQDIFAR
ncbi:MAG: hypothetical protein U1E25_15085 [Methylocystis sp.]